MHNRKLILTANPKSVYYLTSERNFLSFKELRETEKRPKEGGGGSSEVDERKSILFAKVGGEIQHTVGDQAGNRATGGGSQEVFLDHHFLEERDCDFIDRRHELHGSAAAAGVVFGDAIGEGPELESRVAGKGSCDSGVLEEAAVAEVGDDEGDVEFG